MNFTETQEMNRADEEESVIYSNEDIIYDDVRTGMEDSDAKRLPCTGSDSVWNRMYRVVLVFLVLLCVLLLTVIIVLRVQHNAETHQHQMNNTILREQKIQIQVKTTDLEKEIKELVNKNTDLEKERKELNKNTDLEKEKDELLNKSKDLEKEIEKLQNENKELKYNETQLLSMIANLRNETTNQSKTNMTSTTSLIYE